MAGCSYLMDSMLRIYMMDPRLQELYRVEHDDNHEAFLEQWATIVADPESHLYDATSSNAMCTILLKHYETSLDEWKLFMCQTSFQHFQEELEEEAKGQQTKPLEMDHVCPRTFANMHAWNSPVYDTQVLHRVLKELEESSRALDEFYMHKRKTTQRRQLHQTRFAVSVSCHLCHHLARTFFSEIETQGDHYWMKEHSFHPTPHTLVEPMLLTQLEDEKANTLTPEMCFTEFFAFCQEGNYTY